MLDNKAIIDTLHFLGCFKSQKKLQELTKMLYVFVIKKILSLTPELGISIEFCYEADNFF